MPRGSKPGERRGGRQPGTPNKKTALLNAALDAATSKPDLSPLDFLLEVMRDSSIPPDWRIKAALAASTANRNALQRPIRRHLQDRLKAGPIVTRCRKPSRLFVEENLIVGGSKGPRPAQKAKCTLALTSRMDDAQSTSGRRRPGPRIRYAPLNSRETIRERFPAAVFQFESARRGFLPRGRWLVPAARVRVMGQPVVTQASVGICQSAELIPQGSPSVLRAQSPVIARRRSLLQLAAVEAHDVIAAIGLSSQRDKLA
jgi:hypothetical protein